MRETLDSIPSTTGRREPKLKTYNDANSELLTPP
jgi:hypothetical protein